jgi:DNA-binding transcriptional regulator YhcF (GntR family)
MASKTKRMSADEKRKVIIGIYQSSKDVYTEKEIVSLATKAGVNANSILDINQSLCDDNLVDTDKIGGSKYFWSFPAKNDRLKQLEHDETLKRIEGLVGAIKEAEVKLADAKRGREEEEQGSNGDEEGKPTTRASKMARRSELTKAVADKSAELEKLKENDPQAIADLEKELNLVTQAATRWTDNIFACQEVRIVRSVAALCIYILPAFCVCVIVIIVHMRSPFLIITSTSSSTW